MKAKTKIATLLGVSSLATWTLMAGPLVVIQPPSVVVSVPAPVVTVPAPVVTVDAVPDDYVWDGTEYVGMVGDQYYYLGPNHVWLTLDAPRLARFHDWERVHTDWRSHAIRNDLYRHDAHGHDVPFHDVHSAPHAAPDAHPVADHGHDGDDHHDDHHDH